MHLTLNNIDLARRYLRIAFSYATDLQVHLRAPESPWSLPRRLGEQFLLQLYNGVTAKNYYDLGLFERDMSWSDKRQYVGHFDLPRLFRFLNSRAYEAITRDKIVFHLYCEALGIPAVPPLAVYCPTHRSLPWHCLRSPGELEEFLRRPDTEDLFFKTDAGSKGRGALSIGKKTSDDAWVGLPDRKEKSIREIVDHLSGHQGGGWLIQRRLLPHRELADVVPDVLPTVRVMTLLDGDTVHVTGALVRFGDGDTPADNAGSGGIVFLIDLASGLLSTGVHSINGRSRFRTSHHATGVEVSGRQVPFWSAILSLVTEAAGNFPKYAYLGWDVAVTDDGPLILETNSHSGLLSLQKLTKQGVLNTKLRKCIEPVQGVMKSGITLLPMDKTASGRERLPRVGQAS